MGISIPTPDSCSSTRITRADGETYSAPTAVLDGEPSMFSMWSPGESMDGFLGPGDISRVLLVLGYDCDIQLGDVVTNDETAETYVVVEHPVRYKRPTDGQPDHQQVILRRQPFS